MDISERQKAEDVFRRFLALPDDLEVIIENKKAGISDSEHGRWTEYDLNILEEGMAMIRHHKKLYFYKDAGDFLFSILFIIVETYVIFKGLEKAAPNVVSIALDNLKLLAIAGIPLLFLWETVNGGETSILPVSNTEELGSVRVFRRGMKIIIFSIIILDLINLLVGA